MDTTRECYALGCDTQVRPAMLMCRRHWFLVPGRLQRRVWATYVPGQEVPGVFPPTEGYLQAIKDARAAVAEAEGRSRV